MASSGGFGASGLLQGFAQAYNASRMRRTQMDLEQRHMLAGTLLQLYPNARPEAQQDIAQRLLSIYSTPPGKKLDTKLSDISTLGRAATQQGMAATAQANAPTGAVPQPGTGPAPQPPGPPSPLPIAGAGAAPDIGGQPTPAPNALPAIPPPPDLSQPGAGYSPLLSPAEKNQQAAATLTATESARLNAEMDVRRTQAEKAGMKPGTPAYDNFVAGRMVSPYARLQTKYIVGPNGERQQANFNPLSGETTDNEGNVIDHPVGWSAQVNATGTSPWKTFLAAGLSEGKTQREIVDDWNTRQSTQHGFKLVPQPDGSIKMMPVTTGTVTTRGGIPGPPGSKGGGSSGVGPGMVVGGKIPPEVAKANTTYQASISRFNIMSEALPQALAGNQQAMINLLYNHIGMTIGLQKGARITQTIIDEAQHSAPWMASLLAKIGIGNEFTMDPELMRGVTLTPEQMHQMTDLAEGRVEQDYRAYQEEKRIHAGGLPQPPEEVIASGRQKQQGNKIPPPPTGGGTVMMLAPDGKSRKAVPADQVEHFKSLGAKVVQ